MAERELKGVLISDFTIDTFAGYLNNDENAPPVRSIMPPFGQVTQVLMDGGLDC